MDPALSDRTPTPGRPRPVADLSPPALGRLFGIDDLPDRLEAVDARMEEALGAGGALLGPASVRVAASGGKRLRPVLTIATAATGGTFDDRVVDLAAAVELVQVGSLVHDDILDEATTRRGQPTINAVEGLNHAVLAGDYILARAAELAAGVSREAAAHLAAALGELCEGQVLEMRDTYDPDRSIDAHLASVRGKTAALFECACLLGAHCAGAGEANSRALARYGHAFGMAFQVIDDVLDLIGDEARLGKPTGNDIASGVYTLPVLRTLDGPGGEALRRALAGEPPSGGAPSSGPPSGGTTAPHRSNGATPAGGTSNGATPHGGTSQGTTSDGDGPTARPGPDVPRAIDLVRRSGAIADAVAAADRYADEARRAVAHLDQTTVGGGLGQLPRTYAAWAVENLTDPRYLEPLSVP